MNPILRAVSRMLDSADGAAVGVSTSELADSLSGETRLRIATRLALVKLAARCEQTEIASPEQAHPCQLCAPLIARRLERLAESSDDAALAGLVDLAPALRDLADTLATEDSPLVVLPHALLELVRAQLH